ncbi:MAG: HEPN domain-containing protein [Candidatus Bathyarchaeia archaeon]
MTCQEEYKCLIERSRRFRETACMQADRGFFDLAAFSLEQSIQLYIEACLLKLGLEYSRTHSIRRLMELLYEVTGREEIKTLVSKFSVEVGALEDAYITSRYTARTYSPEEIMRLKKVVEELTHVIGEIIS